MSASTPIIDQPRYCSSLTAYQRRKSIEVSIGDTPLGGQHPIRIQSMTTVDTMDTLGSVEQIKRMVAAGCEYVRITAPSLKEAQNLEEIKKQLRSQGIQVPLIADIHFTPNAAELAARIVEKVRVNPGNYADKKKFQVIEYSDTQYQAELERIADRFSPLVEICKEYGTAMRIGTNHGSLSDRIMSRYGDTPLGMVESALEFLRICQEHNYHQVVLSMKASNTQVMVQAYRLLVHKLEEEGMPSYPLHLGVTEAGEGEDGRIKSAVGIGCLLEDGLGDTVRVSLTEDPEFEAPVARALVDRYIHREGHDVIKEVNYLPIDPFTYHRRETNAVMNFGGGQVPRVVMDLRRLSVEGYKDLKSVGHFYLPELDKWSMNDLGCDYVYTGDNPIEFMLPNGLKEVINSETWRLLGAPKHKFPLLDIKELMDADHRHDKLNFVRMSLNDINDRLIEELVAAEDIVIVLYTNNQHAMAEHRRFFFWLLEHQIKTPVLLERQYDTLSIDQLQLYAATDTGSLLIDGLGDGIMLSTSLLPEQNKEDRLELLKQYNSCSFGILQAARTRMTKTEYISCPSCGRTLFDLQETTAMIRNRTDHLKGIKIGIMGCIVNGPGEMADADYGYVGSGKGKITLYRGQEVVKRNVPAAEAVDELIEIIKIDGKWNEPEAVIS